MKNGYNGYIGRINGVSLYDPANESTAEVTVRDWCAMIMKEFHDKRCYIGINKTAVTKRKAESVSWFISEVQAMYLKHQEVFAYDLQKTLNILESINLNHIIRNNSHWAYLIGDIIFTTEPLGYFIDHRFDDRIMEEIESETEKDASDSY